MWGGGALEGNLLDRYTPYGAVCLGRLTWRGGLGWDGSWKTLCTVLAGGLRWGEDGRVKRALGSGSEC